MKTVNMLFSNKQMTMFAQHADLFEKFKVIVHPLVEAQVVDDFDDTHVQKIKEKSEGTLVAIYNKDKIYYRNPDVKVISDGQKWQLLDNRLPQLSE